jgi:hypothetical protein
MPIPTRRVEVAVLEAARASPEDESRDDDRDGIPDVYTSIEMP